MWFANRGTTTSTPIAPAAALQIQPLTLTGNAALGALSPDGKFVAYLRREGRNDADFGLWVRQLTVESDVQIAPIVTGRSFVALVVTPDGSYVDFVAEERGVPQPDLWRVPFLGGTPPRRIVTGVWSATGWSPDGRHMAFIRMTVEGVEDSVVVADADGANERVLATRRHPRRFNNTYSTGINIHRPSWSADGRSLMVLGYSRPPDGSRSAELVVIDVATGAESRTVPLEKISLIDAAWLNDRYALVNGTLPGRTPALYRADLVSGALEPVTQDLTQFVGVSLTADHQAVGIGTIRPPAQVT